MIHYHGAPLGGPADVATRFWIGRHAMVSFAYKNALPTVARCCQSFALDNGAYTAWTNGDKLDTDGFAAWINEWKRHPGFDWHIIPDAIEGTEEDNDTLIHEWLRVAEVCDADPVPVWHLHESLERLARLSEEFRRVALGSSGAWATPGTDGWTDRMKKAMEVVCENGRPRCKLHGLRMLSRDIFRRYPFASADSTNAARNSRAASKERFGMYPPAETYERAHIIAKGVEAVNSAEFWTPNEEQLELFA